MGKIHTFIYLLKNDKKRIASALMANFALLPISHLIPDKIYLSMQYRAIFRKKLDWRDPKTFNEKLQWLKIYDRNPEYIKLVDKYEVKKYVAEILGEQYVIPTLGVWNHFDEIDFNSLPDKFVLKCTHDSGSVIICRERDKFDYNKAKEKLEKGLRNNLFWHGREWPYKFVKPRIIAEEYLTNSGTKWEDFKIHNFIDIRKFLLVCQEQFENSELIEYFLNKEWRHLELICKEHYDINECVNRPKELDEMVELAKIYSNNMQFCRTDFYTAEGRAYFGEITFYSIGGSLPVMPENLNENIEEWAEIPDTFGGGVALKRNNFILWVHIEKDKKHDELSDYKFFCFNGSVKCFKIDFDRFVGHRANYYDRNKNLLYFGETICPPDYERKLAIPAEIDNMISLAERLAKDYLFVRVDFYDVGGKILFGEMTFYPASGFGTFIPDSWDRKLGDELNLI